jgi:prevent-host-death family protein
MQVDVGELVRHLREYLDRAAQGMSIVVTDGGRPKAILGPVPELARVRRGMAEGWITMGSGGPLSAVKPARSIRTIREVMAEDRGA